MFFWANLCYATELCKQKSSLRISFCTVHAIGARPSGCDSKSGGPQRAFAIVQQQTILQKVCRRM